MNTYAELKSRHRAEREDWPQGLSLRVHRALSWLDRAERCEDDLDGRFLFLWIAFNAAYASELDGGQSLTEQSRFRNFIHRLVELDDKTL
ncbi:MAG: hypothetical protein V2I66_14135, partial [Halieaceae bacterium]|nr:hypothetical protein [Halieaceae bacterium]